MNSATRGLFVSLAVRSFCSIEGHANRRVNAVLSDPRSEFITVATGDGFDHLADWIPQQTVLRWLLEWGRNSARLDTLVGLELFATKDEAVKALLVYHHEALQPILADLFIFHFSPEANRSALNERLSRANSLLDDFIAKNGDLCGFRHLPVALQRKYSEIFHDPSELPHFPVITRELPREDVLALFPWLQDESTLRALTPTTGYLTSPSGLKRFYDLEQSCAVVFRPEWEKLQVIPEVRVSFKESCDRLIVSVWWPDTLEPLLIDIAAYLGEGFDPTGEIRSGAATDGRTFYFLIGSSPHQNADGDVLESLLIGKSDAPGTLTLIYDSFERGDSFIDGDIGVFQDCVGRLALTDNPRYASKFPAPHPTTLGLESTQAGSALVNTAKADLWETLTSKLDELNHREVEYPSGSTQSMMSLIDCLRIPGATYESCKEAIEAVFVGKPFTYMATVELFDPNFFDAGTYIMTLRDQISDFPHAFIPSSAAAQSLLADTSSAPVAEPPSNGSTVDADDFDTDGRLDDVDVTEEEFYQLIESFI